MATAYEFLVPSGPLEGLEYPLNVTYCGYCTMPIEYCEYSGTKAECQAWQQEHLTNEMRSLDMEEGDTEEGKKKRQSRGGKGSGPSKKVSLKEISVFRSARGNAYTTSIMGCKSCPEIEIKAFASLLGKKFCCGSSYVKANDEILIQGSFKDDVIQMMHKQYPTLKDVIRDLGDKKRPN
ncbi:hypothetical protein Ciccas_005536 [Cichlidogyrus casuarinus]|uniref:SUI1 domain-containing protein n=1 Tax=Cichlidogyrus casuarinus TaxID=1844966 RepID=A0ABD2Q8D0_9PLAT